MDQLKLKEFVLNNPTLVKMRESNTFPGLYVLKYSKKVFFDDLWNEFLEECRGTIVDEDFNVVSRPFTKIYNYGIEKNAPVLSESDVVLAFEKINGFMVAVTEYNGELLVSTTGSTENDYVTMAKSFIVEEKFKAVLKECPNYTFMFECVHKDDPHIIPEKQGLYLLGYRKNEWDSGIETADLTELAIKFGVFRPFSFLTTVDGLLTEVKKIRNEGFVFYTQSGKSSKIKTPYYLTLKWIARNPRTDKLLTEAFMRQIDEEYYPLLHYIRENIETFTSLDEQQRLAFIRDFFDNLYEG